MKTFSLIALLVLVSACICFGQQSPPSDGVGLGNDHLSPNSSDSNVPSMSPDQNAVMTDSNGSTSGDQGTPAFAGAPSANSASSMNAQGTSAASDSASATAVRRESYGRNQAVQQTQKPANPAAQKKSNSAGSGQSPR